MRLLFTTTLVIFTISLFSNPLVSEPEGNHSSTFLLSNNEQFGLLGKRKKKPKYVLMGITGEVLQTLTTGSSKKSFTPDISSSFEFFSQFDRFYYAIYGSISNMKAKKDIYVGESSDIIIKDSELQYSVGLFKMGYSVIFKEQFRITPYGHFGIGDLLSSEYSSGDSEKTKTLFTKFTTGVGVKAQYIIIELDEPKHIGYYWLPTTVGIVFDAGYNYQFNNTNIPFGGNMGYVSFGVFAGTTLLNRYRW